jgi:hypothetical protein
MEMDEVELSFHFYDAIVNIVFAGHRIASAEGQKQNATRSSTPSVRILVVSVLKRILSRDSVRLKREQKVDQVKIFKS